MSENRCKPSDDVMGKLFRARCEAKIGVLDSSFLCQSVGIIDPQEPVCVTTDASVDQVMAILRKHAIGCVLVVDGNGKLQGIFTERDYVLKVYGEAGAAGTPIGEYMTREPVVEHLEIPIAYALNLMSQGGFRHLPLVDDEGVPVGIISVKDVMDYIVSSYVDELLEFELVPDAAEP